MSKHWVEEAKVDFKLWVEDQFANGMFVRVGDKIGFNDSDDSWDIRSEEEWLSYYTSVFGEEKVEERLDQYLIGILENAEIKLVDP